LNTKIRAGILGAGGFTGQELIRIIARHPQVELTYLTSTDFSDKNLDEAFPALVTSTNSKLKFSAHPQKIADVPGLDVIFLATPDEVSERWAPEFASAGVKVIDISGAFRLAEKAKTIQAVYGLTEVNRNKIKEAKVIANPGCYPTAALLPLCIYQSAIDFSAPVIIDAKSGTSGAGGRKEKDGLGYSTVYENFRGYKTAGHQHAPEIAQELGIVVGKDVKLRFTPHLLPLYRGIHSTAYVQLKGGITSNDLQTAQKLFAGESFLRAVESVDAVELRRVQHTNFCDYAHYYDESTGVLQIVSAIDNLMKGAAGQAIQNMNLMFGLDERLALT